MKGNGVVLRSKTPAAAEQEIWALLCAYRAIRDDLRRRAPGPRSPRSSRRQDRLRAQAFFLLFTLTRQ
jgi:hypothetical protein